MNNLFLILILALPFFPSGTGLAQQFQARKDLKSAWLQYHEGKFVPYSEHQVATDVVYLDLGTSRAADEYLFIDAIETINVFVNNKLAATGTHLLLNLDSLARAHYTEHLRIGIHQHGLSERTVSTLLGSLHEAATANAVQTFRPGFFFRDFGILAGLLLTALAVVIIRLNPKLAADYFSVGKMISLREDESQMLTRIGNSTNVLFYFYCSLLLGYFFMIVFRFLPGDYHVALYFQSDTFWESMLQWLKLSSVILVVLMAKIILILNLSYLFGITEIGGIHFFNWIRMIVIFFGVLTAVVFIYFISHGYDQNTHGVFLKLVVGLTGAWMVLIFLKLASRANASMFHLFSYICATEVLPFLVIIKLLYN